jgi:ferrochelatase
MSMKEAVLLVSHGTVSSLDDIPAFLRNVRHGREAPPDLVAELRRRYEAIGGSPLDAINVRLAAQREQALGVPVRRASRLWKPYVKDVVAELDVERVVVIPLAQHSAHVYGEAAKRDIGTAAQVVCAENWGQRPALLDAFARRALAQASKDSALVLTAHSLPKKVIAAGDTYEREVRASAAGVIERVKNAYAENHVAFQSQGPGSDASEWLGPSLVETLDALKGRVKKVVFAPVGFLADHVEILYDLDIEAKALANERGLAYARTESLDDADDFVAVLADIARELL